jgi:crotonobetainyl-CoA:carnitine CoA-transferase CaiB-like acyl-CoA transferase
MSRTPDTMAPLHSWIAESGVDPGFDAAEWARLPQSGPGTPGPEKNREFEDSLVAFFGTKPKMELYEEGQRRGILICPVSTPADLLVNEQLIAREFFSEQYSEALGREVLVQGPPIRFSKTPWAVGTARSRPAREEPPAAKNPVANSRDILRGLRVADFSWVGVGPLSTQVLAWLGAEVIRVESTQRLDVFRSGGPRRGTGPDASAYFGNCNRDKRAITLNLKHPKARGLALRLAAESDVLVESFRPDFMTSVGLSYDDIRAANPSIIMMSCSMEGATGPHTRFRGFGLTLQSTVGFTHFTSWPDRAPVGTGVAYTDWFATGLAASAMLAAIEHRRRTGEGQYIDLSQLEACTWALDAEVLHYTATGTLRPALGNRHPDMAPHGVFPCAGEDEWIAIACRSDAEWAALADVVGIPSLLGPELRTIEGRREGEDAIEVAIGAWTAKSNKHELAERLQALGIAAHAVNDVGDVENDAQLRARGHFQRVTHPVIGEVDWDGPPYRLSGTPLFGERAAPLLGQDNESVYRELLGVPEEALANLVADGVLE